MSKSSDRFRKMFENDKKSENYLDAFEKSSNKLINKLPPFPNYPYVSNPKPANQMNPDLYPHSPKGGKLHKKKKSTKRRYKKKGGSKKNYKKSRRMH